MSDFKNVDFKKVVRLGTMTTHKGRAYSIFCEIEYKGGRLSISGVEGPRMGGNCIGGCGQIVMSLRGEVDKINPAPGWDAAKLAQFFDTRDAWHLNDMKAGSPAQEAELKRHKFPGYPVEHFTWAKGMLANAGLQPDASYMHNGKPYSYGTAWLTVDVPEDVLQWLQALPDTDINPAWV